MSAAQFALMTAVATSCKNRYLKAVYYYSSASVSQQVDIQTLCVLATPPLPARLRAAPFPIDLILGAVSSTVSLSSARAYTDSSVSTATAACTSCLDLSSNPLLQILYYQIPAFNLAFCLFPSNMMPQHPSHATQLPDASPYWQ